ncbi:hypothetical protein KHQ82_10545 [Mycoplasmatota bacterium]|nr:hypothetical protein KHQ82_10545 [Mycoplasmatota bacterium]
MKESLIAMISYLLIMMSITILIYKSIKSEKYSMRGVSKVVKLIVVALKWFNIIFGVIFVFLAIPAIAIIFISSSSFILEGITWTIRGNDIDFILVPILVLVIPYALYLTYRILLKSEIIFENLANGIVFCDEIYNALKSISLFITLLLPLSMVELSNLETMQHTSINITIFPIFYIFLAYIIQLVYKEALKLYNENRLTI